MQPLFPLSYNTIPHSAQERLTNAPVNAIEAQQNNYYANVYRVNCYVDPAQLAIIQEVLSPIPVTPHTGNTHPMTRNHPIIAALNDFANVKSRAKSMTYRHQGLRTINIGGRGQDLRSYDHVCTTVNGLRDCSRRLHDNLIRQMDAARACTDGAENCLYQADLAWLVDSIYDIDAVTMHRIFDAHNLSAAFAWLHIDYADYGSHYKAKKPPRLEISHNKMWW